MKRWIIRSSVALAAIALLPLLAAWLWLRASLPLLDGEFALAEMNAPATITRDANGVATVTASNEPDLARAIGFLHGQERFFQMDLLRRSAAGEVAALVGSAAVEYDQARRIHEFRNIAQQALAIGTDEDRLLLQAYADGVNAGLAALGARPFEYGLLRVKPQAWQPEDSLLVVYAMYFDLHDEDARRERYLAALHEAFPAEFVNFLVPGGTHWDAPIQGEAFAAAMPSSEIIDFRGREEKPELAWTYEPQAAPGSNSWAVSAVLSASGRPIIANDMHLGHRVPNIWFRLQVELEGADGYTATGVSLPGVPGIVAGSNGHVAWSFTNAYGDFIDLVQLETEGCEGGYRTPAGCEPFEIVTAEIEVAGGRSEAFEFQRTRWGPVASNASNGGPILFALRWTAHEPAATNMRLRELAAVKNVAEAIEIAHVAGMPPQNFIVADHDGNIAWTIIGRIPRREGHDGLLPLRSETTQEVWNGWLTPNEYPLIANPSAGRLWSANARMVDGEFLQRLGDGGYSLGARAAQIRDRLHERDHFSTLDMLQIQLDDEARFMARWQQLLLAVLDEAAVTAVPERASLREAVAEWEGRASTDAVAYRLVRTFRNELLAQVFGGLTADVKAEFPGFGFGAFTQSEGPLWQLVTERPAHLLPPGHDDWRTLLLHVADELRQNAGAVNGYRWGARNITRIDHPLGRVPLLGLLVNAPRTELPGDIHMPRVQGPGFGASQRFAVSPGLESEAYFHMPGGQSGHPLSPFYLAGHRDWERGEPTSFLPGPVQYSLRLLPVNEDVR